MGNKSKNISRGIAFQAAVPGHVKTLSWELFLGSSGNIVARRVKKKIYTDLKNIQKEEIDYPVIQTG